MAASVISIASRMDQSRSDALETRRFPELIPSGRLMELSGRGTCTLAASFVLSLQELGEPVAWIEHQTTGSLYPPDLAAAGIDLRALPIIMIRGDTNDLAAAAETLIRSSAFGGIVLDLGSAVDPRGAWQNRLSAVARKYDSRVLMLTRRRAEEASLGPMVSIRTHAKVLPRQSQYEIHAELLKNKMMLAARMAPSVHSGPPGLEPLGVEAPRFQGARTV